MHPSHRRILLAAGLSLCLTAGDACAQQENAAVAIDLRAQPLSGCIPRPT